MPTWKHSDVFPIIVNIIRNSCTKEPRYVTHDEITFSLLADPAASSIIADAHKEKNGRSSLEWIAHNMVAWFSKQITDGKSVWGDAFERQKIGGKWAYRPKDWY